MSLFLRILRKVIRETNWNLSRQRGLSTIEVEMRLTLALGFPAFPRAHGKIAEGVGQGFCNMVPRIVEPSVYLSLDTIMPMRNNVH